MPSEITLNLDRAHTYLRSAFFEKLVEHVFISELLQEAWYRFGKVVEVLRSEVDSSGFDVVFECDGIVRHVQLKTTRPGAKASSQKVNIALASKPSGCVIWLAREEDTGGCRMKITYRYFGGGVGEPLPLLAMYKTAKHTKANSKGQKSERPNVRVIPKSAFRRVPTVSELVKILFGFDGGTP